MLGLVSSCAGMGYFCFNLYLLGNQLPAAWMFRMNGMSWSHGQWCSRQPHWHFPYPYGSDVKERPYVQILLRDAVRHPWPLNENVPVFDTLSRIYTGSFYLFDLASFVISFDLKDSLVLPQGLFGIWPTATNVVALRPHQTKGAKRLRPFGNPQRPRRKMLKSA